MSNDNNTTVSKDNNKTTPPGMIEPGNIDLNKRKVLKNPDGSISTESSISVSFDEGVFNIPTVIDGKRYSEEEAIEHFKKTGRHLGLFDSVKNATAAAFKTHVRQEKHYLLDK